MALEVLLRSIFVLFWLVGCFGCFVGLAGGVFWDSVSYRQSDFRFLTLSPWWKSFTCSAQPSALRPSLCELKRSPVTRNWSSLRIGDPQVGERAQALWKSQAWIPAPTSIRRLTTACSCRYNTYIYRLIQSWAYLCTHKHHKILGCE